MGPDLVLLPGVSFRGREIAGPRLQGLVALLAGDLRTGCGTGRLVDGLWPDGLPDNPPKALQVLVSRARSRLGADVVTRTPTGYRLTLAEDQVDSSAVLLRAEASARCARAGDHAAALSHADAGLALWGGAEPVPGDADGPVAALRARRWTTHRALVRARALALARLDRPAEAVDPLVELAAERPRDEEVLVELLRCEAATVGPAAALARYDEYRRALRDELGTDPGPPVRAEHRRLLRGAPPAVRRGVAHEPNPLLGRDDDIAAVEALLRTSRVTSVVGPGGLGKTRLANAVARRAEGRAVTVVPLAGLGADEDVVREVAAALGVGGNRAPGDVAAIAAALAGPSLLVLDNCEHVVAGVADLVGALVSRTAELRVLTTGRTPLGLSSESVHRLPGLSARVSAELFGQRARAARPGVDLPAAAVAEVCRHLDGLPLAIELAAARVRALSVPEIARRLDDRFALLRGGARDAPPRHRALHAVVDWSWNLLDPTGRAAMRALSVFPDGFTADAARPLLGALPGVDVLAVLEHLADHSLVEVVDTPSGTRLRMLDTIREFSAARLAEEGGADHVTTAFLGWARAFGAANHAALLGPGPDDAAAAVRAEQENLRQALGQALDRDDRPTVAAVAAVLGVAWTVRSNAPRLAELVRQTSRTLVRHRPGPDLVEPTRTALTIAVAHAFASGGPRPVREVAALRRLGPAKPDTVVRAVGRVVGALGDPAELRRLCDHAEPLLAGVAGAFAGYLREGAGDLDGALVVTRRALDLFTGLGSPWPRAFGHGRVAELCLRLGRGAEARDHLLAALPLLGRFGARVDEVGVRAWLVLADLQVGDAAGAQRWLDGLAGVVLDDDEAEAMGYDLAIRGEVRLARGEVEAGLGLWRRAVDQVRGAGDAWAVEARAVAVVAHARHGRLDLVADVADALPGVSAHLVAHLPAEPVPHVAGWATCGALLLAVATADLARGGAGGGGGGGGLVGGGADPARDGADRTRAARMIALAERFPFPRTFHPTMASAPARADAERADRAAYDEAVSSYAALDRAGLRAVALELLGQRARSRS
ncbi:ATP-binding protein [Saccharothrix syringae]|uniref:AfsR/SARP family transcriptional regulator n=1 Tax=Saccharothrix syringae TaxID=103733 RepID=A0A5Q0GXY5_SACSY|nr:BTAD domain-containing putative transcriptional regulator [Saccharothrix syringae]QFZ18926.1 AfsR/SARP family transcriptional regulator [Saccharothrix syringae]